MVLNPKLGKSFLYGSMAKHHMLCILDALNVGH